MKAITLSTRSNRTFAGTTRFHGLGAVSLFGMALGGLLLVGSVAHAASVMIIDRGLPAANLNDAAAANRANVSWAEPDLQYLYGDDFTVPGSGTSRVDTIRL